MDRSDHAMSIIGRCRYYIDCFGLRADLEVERQHGGIVSRHAAPADAVR